MRCAASKVTCYPVRASIRLQVANKFVVAVGFGIEHETFLHELQLVHEEHEEEEAFGILENSFAESEGFSGGVTWIQNWGYVGTSINHSTSLYGIAGGHAHAHEEEEEEPV